MADERIEANRANWDERVASHLIAYGVDGFVADSSSISSVVRDDAAVLRRHLPGGSVEGARLVHLQCHIGTDTLSWARLGAEVTGIDFSSEAIGAARELATRAGLSARFVVSDVERAAEAVEETFDVVYTSIGVLTWLPELSSWARTIAALLRPGGVFFIRDSHPIANTLDHERSDGEFVLRLPYFPTGESIRFDEGTTYADPDVLLEHRTTHEWPHPMSEIVQSLLDAGLMLTSFAEGTTLPWAILPDLVSGPDGWALPAGRERLPLSFTITATKP